MDIELPLSLVRGALFAVLLLGIVSLLGDVVYEGGRGVLPAYLSFLGAGAVIVGLVGGLGDLLSHSFRVFSGYIADYTRAYWALIIAGYALIGAIPLIALADSWELVALLIVIERLGKALRTPARDALLSFIGHGAVTGRVFGLHEAIDQLGAIVGPLALTLALLFLGSYKHALALTSIPFLAMILTLFYAYRRIGGLELPKGMESRGVINGGFSNPFYLYLMAVAFNGAGLVYPLLIPFRVSQLAALPWLPPLAYLIIQLIDAPTSLVAGYFFDKIGLRMLFAPFALSIVPSLLVVHSSEIYVVMLASAVFGVVLGMQESVYRAAVALLSPTFRRGAAYGLFNSVYGASQFGSGLVFGYFIEGGVDLSITALYVLLTQLFAIYILYVSIRSSQ